MALRTGFAGVGHLGAALLEAAARVDAIVPVAIQDPGAARLQELAAQYPDLATFTDYEALIETAGLEAVVISTPTYLHATQGRMALARGIHALVQKPIARNGAEADALLDTAAAGDARLLVDYSYRYTPAAQAARAAVEAGRLGTLRSVQARFHNIWGPPGGWFFDRERAGGGALMDLGVHMIDLPLYLLGFPPAGITAAHLWRGDGPPGAEVEDFATLTGTIGGAPFHCEVSWQVPLPQTEISLTLYGTEGTLAWHNLDGSFFDFAAHLGHHQWDEPLASGPADLRGDTLRAFVAACAASDPPELTPYRRVPALLDAAYALARAGR
jgi:predicted dehydrogenase